MKINFCFFVLTFIICSCNNTSNKKELTSSETQKITTDLVDYELNDNKEKIILLATIKEIQSDSLYSILRDYYAIVGYEDDFKHYCDAIEITAKKHNMTKIKIANLIFSFKYEMIDNDEMIETEGEIQKDIDANIDERMRNQ